MDIRDFLALLDREGQLKTIDTEVDWYLEAACIAGMANRVEYGRHAVHFTNIKGYEQGSIAGSLLASSRKRIWQRPAMALGMHKDTSWPDFRDEFIRRQKHPLKPIVVSPSDASCKEEIHLGEEVNMFEFPFPFTHQFDGGRYQTYMTQIVKDPDTGWVNWGQYRFMLLGKNKLVGLMQPGQHGPNIFYLGYEARNKPCPFCYVIGGDIATFMAASLPLQAGVCEADYAGALRQEPLKVVRAETNDLYVPADAEIVIEGVLMPGERADEGPFGEYSGYVHGRQSMPIYRVQCITHRKNPILPMSVEGSKTNENQVVASAVVSTEVYRACKEMGYPVRDVFVLPESSWACIVVSTEVPYEGYVDELINFISTHKAGIWGTAILITDADVDVTDSQWLLEEMACKIDPKRDLKRSDNDVLATVLLPMVNAKERKLMINGARAAFDATTPLDWTEKDIIKRLSANDVYPELIYQSAQNKLKSLGS